MKQSEFPQLGKADDLKVQHLIHQSCRQAILQTAKVLYGHDKMSMHIAISNEFKLPIESIRNTLSFFASKKGCARWVIDHRPTLSPMKDTYITEQFSIRLYRRYADLPTTLYVYLSFWHSYKWTVS